MWNSAKSKIKFSSWAKHEPNNYNAKCNIENCVVMSKGNGKWSDVICNAFYPFVCESAKRNGKFCILSRKTKILDLIWFRNRFIE